MAIPLIPFVAGAVVGGLATYLYRDEKIRQDVKRAAGSVSGKVKDAGGSVSHKVSEGLSSIKQRFSAKDEEAAVTPTKKVSRKKASRRKTVKATSRVAADRSEPTADSE